MILRRRSILLDVAKDPLQSCVMDDGTVEKGSAELSILIILNSRPVLGCFFDISGSVFVPEFLNVLVIV